MPDIVDDKSPHVIPFIVERLQEHRKRSDAPFFIGLNGVQGIGKTTLVTSLSTTLSSPPHNLPTLTLSIDDLYLPYEEQRALAASDPDNPLIQHRGQPSTHDVALGLEVFRALRAREPGIRVPAYDKSAHGGRGDRVDPATWRVVNDPNAPSSSSSSSTSTFTSPPTSSSSSSSSGQGGTIDVVIFEGWCVGFRSLPDAEVEAKWRAAKDAAAAPAIGHSSTGTSNDGSSDSNNGQGTSDAGRLAAQRLCDVRRINDALLACGYDELFGPRSLHAFVHLDAAETPYVYAWRREQEAALREAKGEDAAMSDDEVVRFVDGYYPAYELFGEGVRRGVFRRASGGEGGGVDGDGEVKEKEEEEEVAGRQIRLVVGRDRRVEGVEVI